MKAKLALSILLVAALALFGMGCNKATGGGQFNDTWTGNKITFGFNAQPTSDDYPYATAKGHFHLVDHGTKTKINGTFTGTFGTASEEGASWFSGTCSINGEGETYFEVTATDLGKPGLGDGDHIFIQVGQYGDSEMFTYEGYVENGNITVHKAKKK